MVARRVSKEASDQALKILSGIYTPLRFGGRGRYARSMRGNPMAGEMNRPISSDYADVLRREGEETLSQMPDEDLFKETVIPTLESLAGKSARIGPRIEIPYEMDTMHKAIGVKRPRHLTSFSVRKGNISPDAVVKEHLREGRVEQAAELLFDQMQNVARLYPTSLARTPAEFYGIKSIRDEKIAEVTGLPKIVINAISSINSAQAGPALEEFRTLAVVQFLRVAKNGKLTFDEKSFAQVYGESAAKQPGIRLIIDAVKRGQFDDPDFARRVVLGLSDKTYPYMGLAQNPGSSIASVADTIDAGARIGGVSATLPTNGIEAFLAQLPTRSVAAALGQNPSQVQTGSWLLSRGLKGEAASRAPMTYLQSTDELAEAAAGQIKFPIGSGGLRSRRALISARNSKDFTPVSDEVVSYFGENQRQLARSIENSQRKRLAGEPLSAVESQLADFYVVSKSGQVSINPQSIEAALPPASREQMAPVLKDLLERLPNLRGVARVEAIAILSAITGLGTVAANTISPGIRRQAISRMAE